MQTNFIRLGGCFLAFAPDPRSGVNSWFFSYSVSHSGFFSHFGIRNLIQPKLWIFFSLVPGFEFYSPDNTQIPPTSRTGHSALVRE